MTDPILADFVEKSLSTGASRSETEQALLEAGWARDQVSDALSAYAESDFPVPVPRPKARLSARDAFLYLVMFGMLYVCAFNLGSLLFQVIDLTFPDPLSGQRGFFGSADWSRRIIRWATSSLLVAFPVFLFTAYRIARHVALDPARRASGVRKWLTYLTLFVAACIVVGDLIVLVNSLLSGELTIRVVLKTLTVGAIAGGIFGYYLWSLRADDKALAQ